ncbi:MAG: YidC/Oxa1 family membrane protein insertase [Lachnospiraceae bacterium]|nr:YidC/Oxa1 family membrane protein insertase [Lachnospiraceae bacterium]
MEWIFEFTSWFGVQNFGIAIVLFTIIVNLLMLPLTIKQQKFTRVSAVMNPEIQAINKKYKGKNDNDSLMKMREETNEVYAKYGVKPSGGCLQIIIQMPIFFALWKVISNIPAYVPSIKEVFTGVIEKISADPDYISKIQGAEKTLGKLTTSADAVAQNNYLVDLFYTFTQEKWEALQGLFPSVASFIDKAADQVMGMNKFFQGVSLTDTPMNNWKTVAILIPILAGVLQWVSVRLTTVNNNSANQDDNQMGNSMKMMNNFMPFFSAFVCLSMSCGLGIYWIASSGVRIIIQLIINFYYGKMELQEIINRNVEKNNKKRAKKGLPPAKVASLANVNTRNISSQKTTDVDKAAKEKKEENIKKATEYYNSGNAKPGSIAAKAQMVQKYNEKNNK